MKKKSSRIVALVLTLCMVFFGLPVAAMAEGGVSIDGTPYESIEQAIDNANDNDVIEINESIVLDDPLEIRNKSIVLDLNGNDISCSGNTRVLNIYDSTVEIRNGTVKSGAPENETPECIIWCYPGAHLEIAEDAVVQTSDAVDYCIGFHGTSGNPNAYSGDGKSASLTVNGSLDGGSGLTINGNIKGEKDDIQIEVNGKITAKETALYLAGNGTTTITDSAEVKGKTGVEIRAGYLSVKGGTIEGTGKPLTSSGNPGGTTTEGAGIAVVQHTTKQEINVVVSGGDISGFNALYEANTQGNSAEDIEKVSLSVTGGTFKAINGGTVAVDSKNKTAFITGGKFDKTVDTNYLANGLRQDETTGKVVPQEGFEFVVSGMGGYPTLQAAVDAARDGDTVTLWKDVVLDGEHKKNTEGLLTISGNKTITVEGKGHLISATNVSVSGNNGPSMINVQGGANVTFRNLTIDGEATNSSGNTKHGLNLYQAFATVEDVTIKNNRWYAIVANGSELTVNGLTTEGNHWGINVDNKSGDASLVVNEANIEEESSIVFDKGNATGNVPTGTIKGGDFQYIIFNANANDTDLEISGGTFETGFSGVEGAVDISKHLADDVEWNPATGEVEDKTPSKPSSTSDDTPSLGYRLPYIGESTGGKNFVSDTTGNLTVNGKYQFRITSTDGHKPVMTVSNSNFTVELASRSGNDYFYVIRCAGAAGSTANVLVDGIHVVVATVGTAGVVSDTTHPFTVAQGAAYQFKLTSASRPTFTGNNANFTIAYVSNSGNDWFFKVTAAGAAGASTTFSANGVVVTTATIA